MLNQPLQKVHLASPCGETSRSPSSGAAAIGTAILQYAFRLRQCGVRGVFFGRVGHCGRAIAAEVAAEEYSQERPPTDENECQGDKAAENAKKKAAANRTDQRVRQRKINTVTPMPLKISPIAPPMNLPTDSGTLF